jgi:hypothetical protein
MIEQSVTRARVRVLATVTVTRYSYSQHSGSTYNSGGFFGGGGQDAAQIHGGVAGEPEDEVERVTHKTRRPTKK